MQASLFDGRDEAICQVAAFVSREKKKVEKKVVVAPDSITRAYWLGLLTGYNSVLQKLQELAEEGKREEGLPDDN